MKERRIKKATIGRSGNHYYNKGFNLEILDDSGYKQPALWQSGGDVRLGSQDSPGIAANLRSADEVSA